jgi:uncharacterized repeat protein (TIGR01451 family)
LPNHNFIARNSGILSKFQAYFHLLLTIYRRYHCRDQHDQIYGLRNGNIKMMMLLTRKSAFAVALCLAAGSGSLIAMTTQAKAQSTPVTGPAALPAVPSVTLVSTALIERKTVDANGQETITYKVPSEVQVVPGDKVVFKLSYSNKGNDAATGFRATNPVPAPIQFVSAREDWAEVSVDGGVTWGKLADLTIIETAKVDPALLPVAQADGAVDTVKRSATAADVTHIRWVFTKAIPPGTSGDISYSGVIK